MRAILIVVFCLVAAPMAQATEIDVEVTGRDALKGEIAQASLARAAVKDTAAQTGDIIAAARADYTQIVGILYGRGFYGPTVSIRADGREVSGMPVFDAPARIEKIVITVDTGPPFTLSRAEVAPLAPGTVLPEGFAPGERAEARVIREAAAAGVAGWREFGHAKAQVSGQRVTADHRDATLSARVTLSPGPRLRFGRMDFTGRTRVRPERLAQIAGLPLGEVFSPDEVADAAARLRRTGTFRSVSMTEGEANADGTIDITAAVVDERRRRIGFGAELSSLEGLGLSAFWLHRNAFGGAERLRFDASIGGLGGSSGGTDFSLGSSLTRPATFGPDTSLTLTALIEDLDEPDFKERKIAVGAGLSREINDRLTLGAGIGLRYSEVEDDLGRRYLNHALLPLSAEWDGRDSALNATRGLYGDLEVTPFLGLNGSASGGRIYADARAYRPLGDRVVLAGRFQLGSVLGAGLDEVPPDMLFFSGGGGTVRGQPYQSLGVTLPGGQELGGRSFIGLSAEMRLGVTGAISVVGFADAGFVGSDAMPGQSGDWHSGAGVGLRYDTGIGPIRFDIAAPVDGTTGDGVQIYIGIGQAF